MKEGQTVRGGGNYTLSEASPMLRWNKGVLQQAQKTQTFVDGVLADVKIVWRDVPEGPEYPPPIVPRSLVPRGT